MEEEKLKVPEFKLHPHGDNWFHFRRNMGSINETFTVTYLHDGTTVMSGDYGCLCWKRRCFPERPDYGFPGGPTKDDKYGTNIGYFAEKINQHGVNQKIEEWDEDFAIVELKADLYQSVKDGTYSKTSVDKFFDSLHLDERGDVGICNLIDQLNDFDNAGEWTDGPVFGERYTHHFRFMFECLKQVSDIIWELAKKG